MDMHEALFDSPIGVIGAEPMHRSCKDLGLCQSRKPACADCSALRIRFAPGVIDRQRRRPSVAGMQWRWALLVVVGLGVVAGLPMAAGYIGRLAGWL